MAKISRSLVKAQREVLGLTAQLRTRTWEAARAQDNATYWRDQYYASLDNKSKVISDLNRQQMEATQRLRVEHAAVVKELNDRINKLSALAKAGIDSVAKAPGTTW